MGLFIKIMVLLVVMALAAPFVLKGPDGEPLMTIDEAKEPGVIEDFTGSIVRASNPFKDYLTEESVEPPQQLPSQSGPEPVKTRVYSWRDEQGNLHFTNIAPKVASKVVTREINPDRNLIKMAQPVEGEVSSTQPVLEVEQTGNKGPGMIRLNVPEGASQLMDNARSVEQTLLERNQMLESQ